MAHLVALISWILKMIVIGTSSSHIPLLRSATGRPWAKIQTQQRENLTARAAAHHAGGIVRCTKNTSGLTTRCQGFLVAGLESGQ